MDMNTLTFDRFSRLDRSEPVSFGIPFAPEELRDPSGFRLLDGDTPVPSQVKTTGTWPDGSVRWLFVRSILDLPGNRAKRFTFSVNGDAEEPVSEHTVSATVSENGSVGVNTGPLSLTVPAEGIWPVRNIRLHAKPLWNGDPFRGFRMTYGSTQLDSREGETSVTVEETGPVCAVVRIDSVPPDRELPCMRIRLFFWAGISWCTMQYTVTDRRPELETVTEVRDWSLEIDPAGSDPLLRTGIGCYRDSVQRSDEHTELCIDASWMKRNTFEHQTDCYSHNSWADWQDEKGGMTVSVRHAAQNMPKGYTADRNLLRVEFFPRTETEALEWFAGTAKTHEVLLYFHGPDASDQELGCRAAHFQLGDYPSIAPERFAQCGVWIERIFKAQHSRKILARLARMADKRPVGYGIFNFGDDVGYSYTHQGRGEAGTDEGDRLVWLNNEYDAAHHYYLFWALTGERRFLEYGLNSARHWMDVDIVHSETDPATRGGHIAHCRRHAGNIKIIPSHQWVQGLFDTYHLTGNPDARSLAAGVADNVAWLTENGGYLKPGRSSTREMGWALRAMLNTWRETGEETYRSMGERIEALFAEWGKGTGELLAPYTVHSEIRSNFMNAVAGCSLAMWAQETGSKRAEQIVTAVADDIIENGMTVFGLPYYKDLPSLRRLTAGTMIIQLFGYACALTGNRKYIEAGLPGLEDWLAGGTAGASAFIKKKMTNGLFLSAVPAVPDSKLFSVSMPAVLGFISAAGSRGLTDQIDFSLRINEQ